ncbi:phosphoribosyl-AMP cyclohydrolase [Erythrobacter sp. WG]|uniref:phosphoribosyl-AMP cyclohydrolase n=1 Tax=Erythrobacter sp. WG TaxID=2985510 RepID=UPI00226E5320|nr:phosphoribosyl-AMP cyclohydrolase [Erythrobacter sp. WG]MCX9147329.1 phosphoribosyl-AMP cyclohydrolase [Erythrobacter sp. WG]
MTALARTRPLIAALALPLIALASPSLAKPAKSAAPVAAAPAQPCISEREVVDAQKAWGEGIVAIGKTYREGGDYTAAAAAHINRFYGYDLSLVLFKPTLASVDQFRTSFDSALSYFVGGNPSFPEDKGFAIKPWTKVRWKNYGIVNNSCNMAVAMGNYWFTPADGGADTKVEYSFAYVRGEQGDLKIVVHHSSVPFNPN